MGPWALGIYFLQDHVLDGEHADDVECRTFGLLMMDAACFL